MDAVLFRKEFEGGKDAFANIECEVEPDLSIIDEMLYRRHTGSQDGVGRSQWDPEGKSFFLQRTGKGSLGLGETIEKALMKSLFQTN
jgi:hypothetical protein